MYINEDIVGYVIITPLVGFLINLIKNYVDTSPCFFNGVIKFSNL